MRHQLESYNKYNIIQLQVNTAFHWVTLTWHIVNSLVQLLLYHSNFSVLTKNQFTSIDYFWLICVYGSISQQTHLNTTLAIFLILNSHFKLYYLLFRLCSIGYNVFTHQSVRPLFLFVSSQLIWIPINILLQHFFVANLLNQHNKISLKFVVIYNILCRCEYWQEKQLKKSIHSFLGVAPLLTLNLYLNILLAATVCHYSSSETTQHNFMKLRN